MMLVRSFPRPEKLPLLLLFVHFPPLKKEYRSFSGVIFVGAKAPCQENPPFLAANPPTSCLLGVAGGLVAFPAQVGRAIAVGRRPHPLPMFLGITSVSCTKTMCFFFFRANCHKFF